MQMITLDAIRQPVEADFEAFDKFVAQQFTAEGELLNDMLRYALTSRGKGVRPLIVLLSAAMHGRSEQAASGRRVQLAAMLIEMIHVASLIHDDVIDESDTRRGRPSVNARWQSHKAVLLGDYLLARNVAIGLSSAQYDLMNLICGTMCTLCEGELLQDESAAHQSLDRRRYFEVIRKKTATLIAVSAAAGALAVHAAPEIVEDMRRCGEALGMAFQIRDDILDYLPHSESGKPAGNDLREGKMTLPLIAVVEHTSDERRQELLERLARCHDSESDVEYLQALVRNAGGCSRAEQELQRYLDLAREILLRYEPTPYRQSLLDLATYIAERTR